MLTPGHPTEPGTRWGPTHAHCSPVLSINLGQGQAGPGGFLSFTAPAAGSLCGPAVSAPLSGAGSDAGPPSRPARGAGSRP